MTKPNLPIKDRFMSHVKKSNDPNACWEWIGAKYASGYGEFNINHKMYYAHRISYALYVGDIPNDKCVCHSCDNPGCINPDHLWLGTYQDNTNDMISKNRQVHVKGENHGRHKLSEQEIYQIREMIEQGYSQREIANVFDITIANVSCIKLRKSWR